MKPPVFATLGCRLNAYETEAMKELAAAAGVGKAVVVNTCAVTAEAVRKAVERVKQVIKEGIDVPEGENDLRKNQLRELALLNGTLREGEVPR